MGRESTSCQHIHQTSRVSQSGLTRLVIGLVILSSAFGSPVAADTIHVYEGESIQTAIDTALDGDEIMVHPGIYNEVLDLLGKRISLRSADGPEATIITGAELEGSVITCANGEGPDTIIDGFTIRDGTGGTAVGDSDCGGGLYIVESSPTVSNCLVLGNIAQSAVSGSGGGAYLVDSNATFFDCVFQDNLAYCTDDDGDGEANGGGAFIRRGEPSFTDCRFEANLVDHAWDTNHVLGAGMYVVGSTLELTRCSFIANRIDVRRRGDGAGIHATGLETMLTISACEFDANFALWGGGLTLESGASAVIQDSSFMNHTLSGSGGGIHLDEAGETTIERCMFSANETCDGPGMSATRSSYTMIDCEFVNNRGECDGGAISNWDCRAVIERCTFSDNSAYSNLSAGGAIYNIYTSGTISDCVFLNNHSGNWGGAIYNHVDCALTYTNCLFAENTAVNYAGAMENDSCVIKIRCCTFSRNSAGIKGHAVYSHAAFNTVTNSIFWDNNGQYGFSHEGGNVYIRYCVTGRGGEGNIESNPLFVNPGHGDFHLSSDSPCIDAGSNEFVAPEMTNDLDGNPRCADDPNTPDTGYGMPPIVDMGVFEFPNEAFTHCEPYPGLAGEWNHLIAINGRSGARTFFAYGLQPGTTPVPGCPGVEVQIAGAQLARVATADESGRAEIEVNVPAAASGRTVCLQAVQRSGCVVSNRVDWLFP